MGRKVKRVDVPEPSPNEPPAPQHPFWEKVVLYAYNRMRGDSQEKAARGVGRSERTGQLWEADEPLWRAARLEADKRWLADIRDKALRAVDKSIDAGNAQLGLTVLERLHPAFAPPRQRTELTGKDGAPLPSAPPPVVFYIPDNGRDQSVTTGNTLPPASEG